VGQFMSDDRVCTEKAQAAGTRPLVRQITVIELKEMMESGTVYELVDVRMDVEWPISRIENFWLLDQDYHDQLCGCDKDTPVIFQCHHGIRSQQAAEYFRQQGFRNLCNVQGGIDAWSQFVDGTVPRY